MEIKISEILAKYDTDKVKGHNYGAAYDGVFNLFDRTAPLNILEVGIQKGGSLCAWKDYFPNAKVTGLDIVDEVKEEYKRNDINYILCDVNEYKTDEEFDIVIDDGSHWLKDSVHILAYFSKKLKMNGVILIEDVQKRDTWIPALCNILHPDHGYNKGYEWETGYFDLEYIAGNYDDVIFMARRIK